LGAAAPIACIHSATTLTLPGLKKYGGMTPIMAQPAASACAASSFESSMDAAAMWLVIVTPCFLPAATHASQMALRSGVVRLIESPVVPLTAGWEAHERRRNSQQTRGDGQSPLLLHDARTPPTPAPAPPAAARAGHPLPSPAAPRPRATH
jgi:hypothetical protein